MSEKNLLENSSSSSESSGEIDLVMTSAKKLIIFEDSCKYKLNQMITHALVRKLLSGDGKLYKELKQEGGVVDRQKMWEYGLCWKSFNILTWCRDNADIPEDYVDILRNLLEEMKKKLSENEMDYLLGDNSDWKELL